MSRERLSIPLSLEKDPSGMSTITLAELPLEVPPPRLRNVSAPMIDLSGNEVGCRSLSQKSVTLDQPLGSLSEAPTIPRRSPLSKRQEIPLPLPVSEPPVSEPPAPPTPQVRTLTPILEFSDEEEIPQPPPQKRHRQLPLGKFPMSTSVETISDEEDLNYEMGSYYCESCYCAPCACYEFDESSQDPFE